MSTFFKFKTTQNPLPQKETIVDERYAWHESQMYKQKLSNLIKSKTQL